MKKLQQLCAAVVFTLVLTTVALGGDISTGGKSEPPVPPSSATIASGEIQTEQDIQNPEAVSDSVADLAIDLLYIMLTMF